MAKSHGADSTNLPKDLEAERFVLGAVLTAADAFPQITALVGVQDFALERHKRILLRLGEMYERGEPLNTTALAHELERKDELASAGGVSYLVEIADVPHLVNLASYCERVRMASVRRQVALRAELLIEQCTASGDLGESYAELERIREALSSSKQRLAARTWDEITADEGGINRFLSPEIRAGIRLPFGAIYETLDGLRPGKLILVGARPGVGKSAFAVQVAEYAAANGNHVLLVTLEMPARDVLHRAITGRASVSAYRFRHGHLSTTERIRVQSAASDLAGLGERLAIVDDANTTVAAIETLLRTLQARNRQADLLIVDYVQLLSSFGYFENRVQEVAAISRGLKRITQQFHIPVLALSQLTRKDDSKKYAVPEVEWLKESGQLEQDADQILFLWLKKEPSEAEVMRTVSWRVAKNRDGMLNGGTLEFEARYCRFVEDKSEQGAAA